MKQSSVIALMATVVAARGLHNHHEKHHMHEKRDMVTVVQTKVEPHVAWATVYVDQNGNRLDGKPREANSYSGGQEGSPKKYGGDNSGSKEKEAKPQHVEAQHVEPEQYHQAPAPHPDHKPAPKYQPESKPAPPPSKSQPKTPEQIQEGYAAQQQSAIAAQQSLVAEQEAKNKEQSGGNYKPPKQQPEQPKEAPKEPAHQAPPPPKKNPPSYSPPSGGEGGMKQGEVTFYAAGLGSCGKTNSQDDHIVALSSQLMSTSKSYCGKSLQIKGPGGTYTAQVQDTCPGCDPNHLDLPQGFYDKVTAGNENAGHVPVSWKWM